MDRQLIEKLVTDLGKVERDGLALFMLVPLRPSERNKQANGDVSVVLRWYPNEEARYHSRELRRIYDAWYHAALQLIEEYIPYQADELRRMYDIMISYITLNRYAETTAKRLDSVNLLYPRGFVDVYLEEYARLIDAQASLIRSIEYLADTSDTASFQCFLTGFACPTPIRRNPMLLFVIMPFAKSFDDVYHLGIREAAKSLNLQCKRADEVIHTRNVICTAICQPIRAARFIVADITGQNANVFYELGMTHARVEDTEGISKHVIIITQNLDDVPFDLRNLRIVHYDTYETLNSRLKATLQSLIEASADD